MGGNWPLREWDTHSQHTSRMRDRSIVTGTMAEDQRRDTRALESLNPIPPEKRTWTVGTYVSAG